MLRQSNGGETSSADLPKLFGQRWRYVPPRPASAHHHTAAARRRPDAQTQPDRPQRAAPCLRIPLYSMWSVRHVAPNHTAIYQPPLKNKEVLNSSVLFMFQQNFPLGEPFWWLFVYLKAGAFCAVPFQFGPILTMAPMRKLYTSYVRDKWTNNSISRQPIDDSFFFIEKEYYKSSLMIVEVWIIVKF